MNVKETTTIEFTDKDLRLIIAGHLMGKGYVINTDNIEFNIGTRYMNDGTPGGYPVDYLKGCTVIIPRDKGMDMSLDKAIEHGKEKRKPYYGCRAIDPSCRNHGTCEWCKSGRLYRSNRLIEKCKQMEDEYEYSNRYFNFWI